MTSTNDGKDVKSNQTSGPKGKTYYIELYKSLEAGLSSDCELRERTQHLCEAWRRIHSLCQHSAPSTHPHLLSWLQRHTARVVLQTEWQSPKSKEEHKSLEEAINAFIKECENRSGSSRDAGPPPWETQLVARGEWFKKILGNPWGHPVLRVLLDPRGEPPSDEDVLEWLKEERGVMFVTRLRQLTASKCDDLALSLSSAVMERVRASAAPADTDAEQPADVKDKPKAEKKPTFEDILKTEAGFTVDVWELLIDMEFVLLHKSDKRSRCIELAKQTPLRNGYQLVERLQSRLETSPREKKLWKNAKEVATLIAQVVITRCMVVPVCSGASRTALYCCARSLVRALGPRLPPAARALAAPAATARHLHTLAAAVDAQSKEDMKPFVCELYVRAITAGMNELERLKLKTEKEADARSAEQTLASWFNQLGALLSASERIRCECTLTAFSVHPTPAMYERIKAAPMLPPLKLDDHEIKEEPNKEFGSWASDSRGQTNFVKTSETLNLKHTQHQANVLSTAIFSEGEALGISPELCTDIAVLLSGPRLKTLSWDTDRELLLENCRTYMERTNFGTRALTTELKYLNLDPKEFLHLPEEEDDESDMYYGIEKGYEHLVEEYQEPDEIWQDADDPERTESAHSTDMESEPIVKTKKTQRKTKKTLSSEDDSDPLSLVAEAKRVEKKKERPHSKERSKEPKKTKSKVKPKDPLEVKDQPTTDKKKEPKKKRERKKKEKLPPTASKGSLSSLIGMKVANSVKKPEVPGVASTPSVSDSDYDSQGKSSNSVLSEPNETEVLYDGLFSMDELKSPEKKTSPDKNTLTKNSELHIGTKANGTVGVGASVIQHNESPSKKDSSKQKVSDAPHSRTGSPSNMMVKESLTKLLHYRRQKAIENEQRINLQPNVVHTYTYNQGVATPTITPSPSPSPATPVASPQSPLTVNVPENPKVYINKAQSEQLSELRNEVNNLLSAKTFGIAKPVIQYSPKTDNSLLNNSQTTGARIPNPCLQKQTQEIYKSPQTQTNAGSTKATSSRPNVQTSKKNVDSPSQQNFHKFLKELQESINAGAGAHSSKAAKKEVKPISRVTPVMPTTKADPKTSPQCAKQSQKKSDFLNTFSRLSYLHKNKVDPKGNGTKPVVDALIEYQSKALQTPPTDAEINRIMMEQKLARAKYMQIKSEPASKSERSAAYQQPDNIQSLLKKYEKPVSNTAKHLSPAAKQNPIIANLLSSSMVSKSPAKPENQYKNVQTERPRQVSTTSSKFSSLTERDQQDLLALLRQQTKLNHRPKVEQVKEKVQPPQTITSQLSSSNYSVPCTSQSTKHKILDAPNITYNNVNKKQITKPSPSIKPPSNANLDLRTTQTKPLNMVKTELNCTKTIDPKPPKKIEILSNIEIKSSTKHKTVTMDKAKEETNWEKVMDAILSHKTPSRGPSALDMALNKEAYKMTVEESMRNQTIVKANSTGDLIKMTNVISKGQSKPPLTSAVTQSSQPPVLSRSNSETVIKSNRKSKTPVKVTQKSLTGTTVLANPNLTRQIQPETPKRHIQTVKRPNHGTKDQIDVLKKLPLKPHEKQFTAPYYKEEDPFISGIPNSDYDLLEELMDDDLRQEIGELSSDDDNFTRPLGMKDKDYSVNKPITPVIQEEKRLNPTVISTTPSQKKSEPKVRCDIPKTAFNFPTPKQYTSGFGNAKSLLIKNAEYKNIDAMNVQPTIAVHKMPQSVIKNAEYKNIDAMNVQPTIAVHKMPQSVIPPPKKSRKQTVHASTEQLRTVDQTNTFVAAVPQQTALTNVVVIGSDIVYQPCAVQTPAISANVTQNTYVTYTQQNMALYQTTQFAAPVVNPLIIGNAITVAKTTPIQAAFTTVASKPETNVQIRSEEIQNKTAIHDSKEAKTESKANSVDKPNEDTTKSEKEKIDINSNKNACERKVLSEVQEKQKLTVEKIEPKITRSQAAKSLERDLMNEVIKDQERLQKKRLSIMNRNISHRSDKKAIPLTYAPLRPLKIILKVPCVTQEKQNEKVKSDNKKHDKTQSTLSPVNVEVTTADESVEAKVTAKVNKLEKTNSAENCKENKSLPFCRRFLLRSSNKDVKIDTELAEKVSAPRKSKVRLKPTTTPTPTETAIKTIENVTNGESINKLKKTKKSVTKKTLNKTIKKVEAKKKATKVQPKRNVKRVVTITIDKKTESKLQGVAIPNEMTDFMDIEDEIIASKILGVMSPDQPIPPLLEIPNVEEILGDIEDNHASNDTKTESCASPSILENDTLNQLLPTGIIDTPNNDATIVTQDNAVTDDDIVSNKEDDIVSNKEDDIVSNKEDDIVSNKKDDMASEITETVEEPDLKDSDNNTTAKQSISNTEIVKEIESYVKKLEDRIKETANIEQLELECDEIMYSTGSSESSPPQPERQTTEVIASVNSEKQNTTETKKQDKTIHIDDEIICIDEDDEDGEPTKYDQKEQQRKEPPNYSRLLLKDGKINSLEKRKFGMKDDIPQSYMDAIIIEDLPHLNPNDPMKKCVRIKLPCGKIFKATVHGQMTVDTNTLFSDPALKSVLLSSVSQRKRYVLNIKQLSTTSKSRPDFVVESHIHEISLKERVFETIDLLSDSDEETQPQSFNTEFGKYAVQTMTKNLLENHQKLFDKKCVVKLKRENLQKYLENEETIETSFEDNLKKGSLPDTSLPTDEPKKNVEEPTNNVEKPAVETTGQPINESVVEPVAQDADTVTQPAKPEILCNAQLDNQLDIQTVIQSEVQSTVQSKDEPIIQSEGQPMVQPTTQADVQPILQELVTATSKSEDEPVTQSETPAIMSEGETEVEPTIQLDKQSVILPDVQPIIEPDDKPIIEPEVQPIIQPVIETDVTPVVEPVLTPVVEPVVPPVVEPVVTPVVEPVVTTPVIQTGVRPVIQTNEHLRPYIEPIIQSDVELIVPDIQPVFHSVRKVQNPVAQPDNKHNVKPILLVSESKLPKPTQQEPEIIEIDDSSNEYADVGGIDSDEENTIVGFMPFLEHLDDPITLKTKTVELFKPAQRKSPIPGDTKIYEFKNLLFRDLGIEDVADNSTQSDDLFLSLAGAALVTDSGNSVSSDFSSQTPSLPDCFVKLTRCDELVRKYEDLKLLKKCFVELVRCDDLVRSYAEQANEEVVEQSDDSIDIHIEDDVFEDTVTDVVPLSRCGSFSILDNCNLIDVLETVDQIDRNNSPVMEAYETIASLSSNYREATVEDVATLERSICDSQWMATKPNIHLQHKDSSVQDQRIIERYNTAYICDTPNENNVMPLKALVLKIFHNHSIIDQIYSSRLKTKLNIRRLTTNRKRKSFETILTDSKIAKTCNNSSLKRNEVVFANIKTTELITNTNNDSHIVHDKTMETSSLENIIELESRTSCFDESENEISASILHNANLLQTEFYINNDQPQFLIDGRNKATDQDTEICDEDTLHEIENISMDAEVNSAVDRNLISEVGQLDAAEISMEGRGDFCINNCGELTKVADRSSEILNIPEEISTPEGTQLDADILTEDYENAETILKKTGVVLENCPQDIEVTGMVIKDIISDAETVAPKIPTANISKEDNAKSVKPEMLAKNQLEDAETKISEPEMQTESIFEGAETKQEELVILTKNVCEDIGVQDIVTEDIGDSNTKLVESVIAAVNIFEKTDAVLVDTEKHSDIKPSEPETVMECSYGNADMKLSEPEMLMENVCKDADAVLQTEGNSNLEKSNVENYTICNNADNLVQPEMDQEICEYNDAILIDSNTKHQADPKPDEPEMVTEIIFGDTDTKLSEPDVSEEVCEEKYIETIKLEKQAKTNLEEPNKNIVTRDAQPEMHMENACEDAVIEIRTIENDTYTIPAVPGIAMDVICGDNDTKLAEPEKPTENISKDADISVETTEKVNEVDKNLDESKTVIEDSCGNADTKLAESDRLMGNVCKDAERIEIEDDTNLEIDSDNICNNAEKMSEPEMEQEICEYNDVILIDSNTKHQADPKPDEPEMIMEIIFGETDTKLSEPDVSEEVCEERYIETIQLEKQAKANLEEPNKNTVTTAAQPEMIMENVCEDAVIEIGTIENYTYTIPVVPGVAMDVICGENDTKLAEPEKPTENISKDADISVETTEKVNEVDKNLDESKTLIEDSCGNADKKLAESDRLIENVCKDAERIEIEDDTNLEIDSDDISNSAEKMSEPEMTREKIFEDNHVILIHTEQEANEKPDKPEMFMEIGIETTLLDKEAKANLEELSTNIGTSVQPEMHMENAYEDAVIEIETTENYTYTMPAVSEIAMDVICSDNDTKLAEPENIFKDSDISMETTNRHEAETNLEEPELVMEVICTYADEKLVLATIEKDENIKLKEPEIVMPEACMNNEMKMISKDINCHETDAKQSEIDTSLEEPEIVVEVICQYAAENLVLPLVKKYVDNLKETGTDIEDFCKTINSEQEEPEMASQNISKEFNSNLVDMTMAIVIDGNKEGHNTVTKLEEPQIVSEETTEDPDKIEATEIENLEMPEVVLEDISKETDTKLVELDEETHTKLEEPEVVIEDNCDKAETKLSVVESIREHTDEHLVEAQEALKNIREDDIIKPKEAVPHLEQNYDDIDRKFKDIESTLKSMFEDTDSLLEETEITIGNACNELDTQLEQTGLNSICEELSKNEVEHSDQTSAESVLVMNNRHSERCTITDNSANNKDRHIDVICEEVDETGREEKPEVKYISGDESVTVLKSSTISETEVVLNNDGKFTNKDHKPQEVLIESKEDTQFDVSKIDDSYLIEEIVYMRSDEILDDELAQKVLENAISQVNESFKHETEPREIVLIQKQDTNLAILQNNALCGEHSGSYLMDCEDDQLPEENILITQQIGADGEIEEIDIRLNVPTITYSKKYPHGLIFGHKFGKMNTRKRKIDMTDGNIYQKKYRKGKNIDFPKITLTTMVEAAYSKEFKQLLEYCSSVKFSYSRPFHKEYIDVQEILQSWPIKGICDVVQTETEKDEILFTDNEKEVNTRHDPSIQTLAEEIDLNNDESDYKSCDVIETNFNMGFGEGSGRVIQNLEDGCGTKFSAATLSDVKQTQPLLLSENYGNCKRVNNTNNFINKEEIEKLQLNLRCIQMKDKVRSFFKKTMTELSYDFMKQHAKDDVSHTNGLLDFPYGLTDTDFIQPRPSEVIVHVVQVGQLPVSAAAQNPVTCDPRVTQVSNVSPSQCSAENSPGDDQSVIKTEYTELTTADLSIPLAQEYVQHIQSMPVPPNGHEAMDYPMGSNYTVDLNTKPDIKIEMEETPEIKEEINDNYESNEYPPLMMNNVDYSHITLLEPNSNVTMLYNYTDKQQEHLQMQQHLHQQQQQEQYQQQQEQYQQQQKLIQQQLEQEQFQQRQIELQQLQLEQDQQRLQEMQQLQLKQQQEEEQKQQQLRLQELKQQQELKLQQEQQEEMKKHQQHLLELKRAQDIKQQQQQQQQEQKQKQQELKQKQQQELKKKPQQGLKQQQLELKKQQLELKQQKQLELKQQQQKQKELKQQQQQELKQQKQLELKLKQQKQQELKLHQQKQQELKQQQQAQLKLQKQQQQELKQQQIKQQKLQKQQELLQKQQLQQQQELKQKQQMQQQQELLQIQQELLQKQQQELQQKQQQELQQQQQMRQQQELQQKQQQELQQKRQMQQQQELQQKQQMQHELQQKQQIQQQQQQQEQQQLQHQQNVSQGKSDQIAHAMNAAGIPSETISNNNRAQALVNMISQKLRQGNVSTGQSSNNFQKTTSINAMSLQQALAQILPPPLNQTNASENNQQSSNSHTPQVLHIVQGKSASGNHQQITLVDNTQQSVINAPNSTPVLHIVQNKTVPTGPTSNGAPAPQSNSFSGLSLVDGGLQQGNQLLHIVNAGNQKTANTGQLLKRVNLLTNLTNAQGGNEQKMVQFVCKSADGKSIQLNGPHQRSMVLRLQPVETPNLQSSQPKQIDSQDLSPTHNAANSKDAEIKSRSIYEENYAKFIQISSPKTPGSEKGTSLPKFGQAFGKQVYQDGGQKNEISNGSAMSPNDENPDCQANDNAMSLDHISQIGSPPLLLRKPSTSQAQPNLVQQLKQTISPMNLHGGVIYTRQIPVNLAGGQTINLITVPNSELGEESNQKQQGEIEPSIIKIVPQTPTHSNTDGSEESSTHNMGAANDNAHTPQPQPQPVLTQMRIKLPMLSKAPQMVSGGRVVRPSFFQIQRNVISGTNQPVYQQLVLTAAPQLGQPTIRLPQAQTPAPAQTSTPQTSAPTPTPKPAAVKATPSESQSSTESLSSSTLEQLREFDLVLEQVKERSTTVQPTKSRSKKKKVKAAACTSAAAAASSRSTPAPHKQHQVLYSVGNTQPLNAAYVNRKTASTPAPASTPTPTTSTFVRSPDSSGIADSSPSSSSHIPHTVTSEPSTSSDAPAQSKSKSSSKSKSRPKGSSNPPSTLKLNSPAPPKPSTQKPAEDEQTTQRILYILAEYKEQVENSPDKDKPAPRRRTNQPSNPGSSKRKKSHRRNRDLSPTDDSCRTMGSEDSSCGTSQGDCNESCIDSHSPQDSPRKVVRKLTFDHDCSAQSAPPTPTQTPTPTPRPQPQPRNVIMSEQTITVARGTAGKSSTAVLMPANYILPVSMIKGGQQIAIVTNRGPKLLTVGGGDGGATNALLLQRLIGPAGLKPVLTRPGVRHVRLPTSALHNLQAFNLATATTIQPPDSTASPAPAPAPPELIETRANSSPWRTESREEVKPERGSSPEGEPWHLPATANPHDYSYEEVVRTDNMDRTVLVVQKKDGSHHRQHRLTHVSAAALRHKYAILEHELRLQEYLSQKSLSEECEDLGVDSPSASELFPEAELLFAASPAHDHTQDHGHHSHTPQPLLHHSIPQPDMDDQIATDQLLPRQDMHDDRSDLGMTGLEDVGIVTVSEDGMQATIALDQEEFARSHPNTTFHSEPTDDGEVQPFTISGLKGRHITSTIFHANRAPGTVLMTAPQTTVISQATAESSGAHAVKYADIDNMINSLPGPQHNNINLSSVLVKDDGLTRFDSILNDNRELHLSNTGSHIVHATGHNTTQVIRRVCYGNKREQASRFLMEESDQIMANHHAKMMEDSRDFGDVDDDESSPDRTELFWESNSASERETRRPLDFSSDSDKCCKSPSFEENNSTDSSGLGAHMRLDSVIKDARGIERRGSADGSSAEDNHAPPLRTYPPKRMYHALDAQRSLSGKTGAEGAEGRRRASARGVVKRGCHCCSGSPAPPRPKKPRQRKPNIDFTTN